MQWAPKSERKFQEALPKVLHYACWLGFVGLMSDRLQPEELLADSGVIHQLVHRLQFVQEYGLEFALRGAPDLTRDALVAAIYQLEQHMPDFHGGLEFFGI